MIELSIRDPECSDPVEPVECDAAVVVRFTWIGGGNLRVNMGTAGHAGAMQQEALFALALIRLAEHLSAKTTLRNVQDACTALCRAAGAIVKTIEPVRH